MCKDFEIIIPNDIEKSGNPTLRDYLLENGTPEYEIDSNESDLYVLKSLKNFNLIKSYKLRFNDSICIHCYFVSQIDSKLWVVIPFAYMNEHYNKRRELYQYIRNLGGVK